MKAHRGEPANAEADIQAEEAISSKEWNERTNRAVFTWQEPRQKRSTVSYEDHEPTWNSGVWKAIRRGSAQQEVRKHRDRVTGAWKQISKQRRRVDASFDLSMVTALQHVREWTKGDSNLYQGEGKRGKHSPAFLRHMGSGLHAETRCRKVYAGQVFEEQITSIEAKKTFGDGGGRNYANS